jgi:hypothetical protein
VIVFTTAIEGGVRGLVGRGPKFFEVKLELAMLGLGEFEGSGTECNFKTVFNGIIKRQALAFTCHQKDNEGNHFGRVQAAQRNNETLPGAKLYVNVRRSDNSGNILPEVTGLGVLFTGVTISFAQIYKEKFYISFTSSKTSPVNF